MNSPIVIVELLGILITLVKAVLMIGKLLKTVENHDVAIADHGSRLERLEGVLMNMGHK